MKKILMILLILLVLPGISYAAVKKSKPLQCLPDPTMLKQISDLKTQNASLKAQITDSQSNVDTLTNKVNYLNQQLQAQKEIQQQATQATTPPPLSDKDIKINALNLKIANLNAKRASDIAKVYSTSGQTTEQAGAVVSEINRRYFIDYDTLEAQIQQLIYSQP